MADGADKDVERKPGTLVALGRGLVQIAQVAARAADPGEARLAAEQRRHLVRRERELLHHVQHGEHVDIAHAVVLRQARLGRGAHAHVDRHCLAKGCDTRAATEMPGDVPQIVAAKEGLRAFAGRAVTGSVKTVAANAVFRAPRIRHGVGGRRFIHESVRKGLHDRDQRNAGQLLAKGLDRRDVGRVVRGREEGKLLHRGQEGIVDKLRRVERTGMNRLETQPRRSPPNPSAPCPARRFPPGTCGWRPGNRRTRPQAGRCARRGPERGRFLS